MCVCVYVYLFLLLCYHSINQIITKYWDRYWCFDVWTFIGFDQGELISIWEMRVSYVVSWSNEWLHVRGIYYKRRCYLVRYSIDILCLDLNGLWCWSYWIKQVVHGNLRPYSAGTSSKSSSQSLNWLSHTQLDPQRLDNEIRDSNLVSI